MKRTVFIASQLREIFLDGSWVVKTNYKEQLMNLKREQAIQKVNNIISIAEIVYHINYYLSGLIKVYKGEPLEIHDKYSYNMPSLEVEQDWERLVSDFFDNSEMFVNQIYNMPEEKLDEKFVDEKYGTNLLNITALVEHGYFHLGQICLLKKMIL